MTSPTPAPRPRADPGAAFRLSQLDQIAEMHGRGTDIRSGRPVGFFIGVGAALLIVVALVWALVRAPATGVPVTLPTPPSALAKEPSPSVPAATASASTALPAAPEPAVAAVEAAASGVELAAPMLPSASAADRARRLLRAKQDAEAHAAQVKAEQDRLQAAELEQQRREAEQQQAAADEARRRAAEPAPARAPPAPEARRTVRETCASSSNVFSEALCRSRECRKVEHEADPVCVRLKEIEEARRRAPER